MNEAEIAHRFIRAAEVERAERVHVGPKQVRSMPLPYVHDWVDKAGWRKEPGDKLAKGADPLADERREFWERMGMMPTAEELSELDGLYDLLMMVDNDGERRALLAWSRSKVGGKAFRRWCFQVEGIHPNTGRERKNRAIARICAQLKGGVVQNCGNGAEGALPLGPEIGDVSGTLDDDVGRREGLNNWASDDAFQPFLPTYKRGHGTEVDVSSGEFNWAQKRNERRRQQAKKKAAQDQDCGRQTTDARTRARNGVRNRS